MVQFRRRKPPMLSKKSLSPKVLTEVLFRKDKRTELFLELDQHQRIELLHSVTSHVRKDILLHVPDEDLVNIIEAVDPDEATDILQLLKPKRREKVLLMISEELKNSLSVLLEFDAETAAGLMTLDYIQADMGDTVAAVAKKFKQHEKATGRPPVILVMKQDGRLGGFLPGHELGFGRQNEKIDRFIKRLPSISYAAAHDEVVHLFRTHPHAKVAVLNDQGDVIGIIYSDDVLHLMREHEGSTLYDFAGISHEETIADPVQKKVSNRYRWLIINLGTAFLAAFTVGRFENTLNQFVLLAVYMPIVAGMGGNAGTQTLAVVVRGIALGQIELKNALRTLRNEIGAAFINGLIVAVLVALVVIVINNDFKIAGVLAMAMVINLMIAGFFGTLVPLVMSKLGKDPATSATIFITTATDVFGFLAFLGLATMVLS